MNYHVSLNDTEPIQFDGHPSYSLLDEKNGCVAGCAAGVSIYLDNEYNKPGVHEDQEGFFVFEGSGWAKVGDQEFKIATGSAFMAPKGVPHSIKKDETAENVKVFWFHSKV